MVFGFVPEPARPNRNVALRRQPILLYRRLCPRLRRLSL